MNRTKLTLLATSLMMAVLGCTQSNLLDSDMSEAEAMLSIDKGTIEVEGASFKAGEYVSEVFNVTSSRSWSLTPAIEAPWIRNISQDNGINLGNTIKEWPVTLTFEDNYHSQDRNVDISVTIDGKRVLLPVTQKAFSPVLALESPLSYNIPEVGDTITLAVRSNCSRWTVQKGESSTAGMTISVTEGIKSDSVTVIVKPNADISAGKEGTVVFSAEGTDDVTVSFTQDICIPRLEIDHELSQTDVLPGEGNYRLIFDTNESWTASLDENASEGVSLSASEGVPGDELFVHFPNATLEGAAATVTITNASGLSKSLTFTQKGCILVSFRKWPDNGGWTYHATPLTGVTSKQYDIPRTADDSKAFLQSNDTYVGEDPEGYRYTFYTGAENSMFRSESCGLVIGSITQTPAFHIEFPAIEGKTLRQVKIMLGNSDVPFKDGKNCEATATGTKGCITDLSGATVGGGQTQEVKTYQKDDDWNNTQTIPSFVSDYSNHTESMFNFILTDTQPNTAYRFVGEYRQVIRWFILYYE